MREDRLPPSRSFVWAVALVALLALLPVAADAGSGADDLEAQINQLGLRARGLTLAALKQLKQLDQDFRTGSGHPRPDRLVEARQRLWEVQKLVDAFDQVSDQLHGLKQQFDGAGGATDAQRENVSKIMRNTTKYRGHLDRFFGKAVADFGEPRPTETQYTVANLDKNVVVRGEAHLGLGTAKYKRPTAGVDFGGADVELGVKGDWKPTEPLNVKFNLDHKKTTEQREYSLTNLGAATAFAISPEATIQGGFGYQKYSDDENDIASFGELQLHADFNYRGPEFQFDAGAEKRSRGYGENESADYGTTRLKAAAAILSQKGHIRLSLDYLTKSNDNDLTDSKDLNARLQFRPASGKIELDVAYRGISHPNIDDDLQGLATIFGVLPQDNNKISAKLQFLGMGGTSTRRHGPEVILYQYPNADDADIYDISYNIESRSRGKKMTSFRFGAMTRQYKDTLQHDYAQVRLSRNSQPIGLGGYSQWNIAVRYYLTAPDDDDPFRLAKLPPPHTIDLYYTAGWGGTGSGTLRQWSLGPILGGTIFIDPEREDAYEDDDNNLIFPHPGNVATVGVAPACF